MSLFGFIKEAIAFRKALKASIQEQAEQETAHLAMTTAELAALSDEDLFEAVLTRTEHIVDAYDEIADGLCALNEEQRILYAVNYLEIEVNNGGLCQFFVNSSRIVAPTVSDYMGIIGANKHKQLYDDFVQKYRIDLNDLSSFDSDTAEDFEAQYDRYPFDEFDDAFYELETLEEYLIPYIKAHLSKF